MSGHNKWSTIKHKKGKADLQRGKLFTKIIRELVVAAKGGADPDSNAVLQLAISKAKDANMPKDTMNKAIQRGANSGQAGDDWHEYILEGYGPGKIAVIVDCLTDNKNRTAGDVRSVFKKMDSALGVTGCVSFMFETRGQIIVNKDKYEEDELIEIALEAGADDVVTDDKDVYEILTTFEDFISVRKELEEKNLEFESAQIVKIPNNYVDITTIEDAKKVIKFIDLLEDSDDVQNVHTNFKFTENVEKELEA